MNNNETKLEEKLEILLRQFLRCKIDYLNSFSGFILKIKPYENAIIEIIKFLINECKYDSVFDIAKYLNKIEAFYYTKYGTYKIWNEKNTNKKLKKLIKSDELINVKISNNKIENLK